MNVALLTYSQVPLRQWMGSESGQLKLLFLRGALGSFGLPSWNAACQLLELNDAACFQKSACIWSAVLGFVFLGESLSRIQIILMGCILVGVVLVTRPSFLFGVDKDPADPLGMGLAFVSSLCVSSTCLVIRKIKTEFPSTPNLVVVNYMICGIMLVTTIASLFEGQDRGRWRPEGNEWFAIAGAGMLAATNKALVTAALGMEDLGPVTSVMALDIVWMFFWQGVVFGFKLTGRDLAFVSLGASAIIFGTFFLALNKWLSINRLSVAPVRLSAYNPLSTDESNNLRTPLSPDIPTQDIFVRELATDDRSY